jgi:hypothetical protein
MAGSSVLHATERLGLPAVLRFVQTSNGDETVVVIRARIQGVSGVSLENIESGCLAMLRG